MILLLVLLVLMYIATENGGNDSFVIQRLPLLEALNLMQILWRR